MIKETRRVGVRPWCDATSSQPLVINEKGGKLKYANIESQKINSDSTRIEFSIALQLHHSLGCRYPVFV